MSYKHVQYCIQMFIFLSLLSGGIYPGYYTMQYSFIFNALKIMHMCVDNVDSKLKGIKTYSESAPICCRYKMYLKIL